MQQFTNEVNENVDNLPYAYVYLYFSREPFTIIVILHCLLVVAAWKMTDFYKAL